MASGTFKSGRYSKHLPLRLQESYEAALADPDLTDLTADVALADARIGELCGAIDRGEAGATWARANTAYEQVRAAVAAKDGAAAAVALQALGDALAIGLKTAAVWDDLRNWLDTKKRLVEAEVGRRTALQQMVPVERVLLLISALVSSVRQHVADRDTLSRIQEAFGRLLPPTARRPVTVDVPPSNPPVGDD